MLMNSELYWFTLCSRHTSVNEVAVQPLLANTESAATISDAAVKALEEIQLNSLTQNSMNQDVSRVTELSETGACQIPAARASEDGEFDHLEEDQER